VLYDPAQFEPLTDAPWDDGRVRDAIAAIVADVDAAFDAAALWPAEEWDSDGWGSRLPLKDLYVGAAGVIWALDALMRRGHAETSLDLGAAATRTLELFRAEPEAEPDEHYHPARCCSARRDRCSDTGAVLARHAVREDGLANWPGAPSREPARLQWCTGAPGILAGAWDYLEEELLLAGAELIWRAGAHGDEKGHGLCHGTSGNGFALLKAFARTADERWLERARRFAVHALVQAERIAGANGRRRFSLFTGDVGSALFAAACLDVDTQYPVIDVL